MSIVGLRTMPLTIFVITGTLMFVNDRVSAEQADCEEINISGIVFWCSKFISKSGPKIPPSPECCSIAKFVGVSCACKFVTKEVEKKFDMKKGVYVFRTCGLNVPKGMQCGSYKVPDARKEIIA